MEVMDAIAQPQLYFDFSSTFNVSPERPPNSCCTRVSHAALQISKRVRGARLTVSIIIPVIRYGSALLAGLRSSKYPFPSAAQLLGTRTLAPRFATPHVNVSIFAVSCSPVMRSRLPSPYTSMCSTLRFSSFSMAASMCFMPPSARISAVETLVCRPVPFQLPLMGLGWKVMTIPNSSATRWRMKRAIQSWSPTEKGG